MSDEDDETFYIDDNVNYKSISCENIPELFLDKLIAKKHFGRFGRINKFILRPNRLACTVDFETEAEAENAFLNSGNYNGIEFKVRFTELEQSHVRNTEEWVDSDVQAELESMRNLPTRQKAQSASTSLKLQNVKSYSKPILKPKSIEALDIPKISGSVKAELEAILNRPATTIEDRYRILDARDKLIRLKTIKTTDIRTAVSTKGTCPDMCPEKERLLRETRNQVSVFELGFNGMDYKIAVKEYSRSSADQEIPLAHELRPEPVLNMTMNYLLHHIMDLCEDDEKNLGDWYHFVWDRTRSIRKDITQQDLCSLESVNLVEQCARFHIHCAARLIAEDRSVFDQKINTENLTKCLQTLKYMYHDLRLKNVKCPNESEFRSYIILLNLNDTNFLWEVNQLPNEIQYSKEIQEAISFYISMESNNYVKFFKLIKKTSYMNACILLRYFHQVRNRALQTILKAYNWSKTVYLPISYLTNILAFESEEDTIGFFNFYNLECFDNKVKIDKNSYYIPDEPYYMERSLEVVEAKRSVSIGEAICGKTLDPPTFEDHEPHCSFDQSGFLKLSAWKAQDQGALDGKLNETEKLKAPNVNVDVIDNVFKIPTASPPISPKNYQQKFSTNAPKSIKINEKNIIPTINTPIVEKSLKTIVSTDTTTGNLFAEESINFFGRPTKKLETSQNIFGTYNPQSTNIFNEANIFACDKKQSNDTELLIKFKDNDSHKQNTFKLPFVFSSQEPVVSTSKQNETIASDYHENKKFDEKTDPYKNDLVSNTKSKQPNKVVTEIDRKRKMEEINKKSLEIFESILKEIENDELQSIVELELQKSIQIKQRSEKLLNDILDEIINEVIEQIVDKELKTNQEILFKYFKQWQIRVQKNIQRRNLINSVPTWTQPESLDEFAVKIAHPTLEECLQEMRRYRLGRPKVFNLNLESKFSKIDLFSILSESINLNQKFKKQFFKQSIYLKFILSIPGELEEISGFESYFKKFLNESIIQPVSTLENSKTFFCSNKNNLSICLRKITGIVPKNEQNQNITTECDHANGMIFVMSSVDIDSSRRRLHHLLKLSLLFNAQIPLVIMLYKPHFAISIIDDLELSDIYNNFDYVKIFNCNENSLSTAFIDCLKFLGSIIENPCELEMQSFMSFTQIAICKEFWQRLNDCWKINPAFRKFCTEPQNVIDLYNDAIDRLCTIAEEDFYEYVDFPQELAEFVPKCNLDIPLGIEYFPKDWKTKRRSLNIGNFLRKMKLKPWQAKSIIDVNELEIEIMNFCRQKLLNNEESSRVMGYSGIKVMLEEINAFENRYYLTFRDKLENMSWLNIFQVITLKLINYLWNVEISLLPTEIIYNKNKLLDYLETPWWLSYEKLNKIRFKESNSEKINKIQNKIELGPVFEKANTLIQKANKNLENYQNLSHQQAEITKSIDLSLYKFKKMEVDNKLKIINNDILHKEIVNNSNFIPENYIRKKRTNKEMHHCEEDDENVNNVIAKAMKILEKVEKRSYINK